MRNAEEQSSKPGCPLCHRPPLCPPSPCPLREDPSEQRAPHTARHPRPGGERSGMGWGEERAEQRAKVRRAPGGDPAARGCPSGDRGGGGSGGRRRVSPRPLGGRLRLLTFSVSRSFTVGNGVRADILCGRRGRAGVSPAGLRCGLRGSEERGGRGRAERSHRPRGGATSGPGAERGRGRGGRGGGPLPAAAPGTRAAAREGSGRGRLPARAGRRRGVEEPGAASGTR